MPELPEVETVRAGVDRHARGWVVAAAQNRHPRLIRNPASLPLAAIVDRKIERLGRRGKFMWFELSGDLALVAHLGMSGQFLIGPQDPRHLRAHFDLVKSKKERELGFHDQRTFGWLSVEPLLSEIPASAAHIALDLFDPNIDLDFVADQIHSRKAAIKSLILNQQIVSGIGNIYADESLWASRIHPERAGNEISKAKIVELLRNAEKIMRAALAVGGTSFDEMYIDVNGESGYFDISLNAYGQEHQPCPRCASPIRRIAFGNRSSHYCPKCQRK
jgi:formamidopyrimidine-DNA glycosylase